MTLFVTFSSYVSTFCLMIWKLCQTFVMEYFKNFTSYCLIFNAAMITMLIKKKQKSFQKTWLVYVCMGHKTNAHHFTFWLPVFIFCAHINSMCLCIIYKQLHIHSLHTCIISFLMPLSIARSSSFLLFKYNECRAFAFFTNTMIH